MLNNYTWFINEVKDVEHHMHWSGDSVVVLLNSIGTGHGVQTTMPGGLTVADPFHLPSEFREGTHS